MKGITRRLGTSCFQRWHGGRFVGRTTSESICKNHRKDKFLLIFFDNKMNHSKCAYLLAESFNGSWYFHVSENFEGSAVCSVKFPVLVPTVGILTPESTPHGNLDVATQLFVDSAGRKSREAVNEKIEELNKIILSLEHTLGILETMNERETARILAALCDEKICERDSVDQEEILRKCSARVEETPGNLSLWRDYDEL
ncbi:hypothetical protein [Brazilian marseillevirus]|uniref:hypothetical protein n=1 Tax=Brazilian marseillevirus TaxID=1813599 RepID=UPI0007857DA7|nr:hypothetical protein A3303_gp165 [Brazilian marseillevirus]AMQ10673.1 hypothetical protein [Brazilian marseillevirus]